jgi:ribosomal protein S27E
MDLKKLDGSPLEVKTITCFDRRSKLETMATKFKYGIKKSKHHVLIIKSDKLFTILPKGWIKPKVFRLSLDNLGIDSLEVSSVKSDSIEIKCPRCKNTWITTDKDVKDKTCNSCLIELNLIEQMSGGNHSLKHIETIQEETKSILIFKSNNKKNKVTIYMSSNKFQLYTIYGPKEFSAIDEIIEYLKEKEIL